MWCYTKCIWNVCPVVWFMHTRVTVRWNAAWTFFKTIKKNPRKKKFLNVQLDDYPTGKKSMLQPPCRFRGVTASTFSKNNTTKRLWSVTVRICQGRGYSFLSRVCHFFVFQCGFLYNLLCLAERAESKIYTWKNQYQNERKECFVTKCFQ